LLSCEKNNLADEQVRISKWLDNLNQETGKKKIHFSLSGKMDAKSPAGTLGATCLAQKIAFTINSDVMDSGHLGGE